MDSWGDYCCLDGINKINTIGIGQILTGNHESMKYMKQKGAAVLGLWSFSYFPSCFPVGIFWPGFDK
jgi:hypothetical protein